MNSSVSLGWRRFLACGAAFAIGVIASSVWIQIAGLDVQASRSAPSEPGIPEAGRAASIDVALQAPGAEASRLNDTAASKTVVDHVPVIDEAGQSRADTQRSLVEGTTTTESEPGSESGPSPAWCPGFDGAAIRDGEASNSVFPVLRWMLVGTAVPKGMPAPGNRSLRAASDRAALRKVLTRESGLGVPPWRGSVFTMAGEVPCGTTVIGRDILLESLPSHSAAWYLGKLPGDKLTNAEVTKYRALVQVLDEYQRGRRKAELALRNRVLQLPAALWRDDGIIAYYISDGALHVERAGDNAECDDIVSHLSRLDGDCISEAKALLR